MTSPPPQEKQTNIKNAGAKMDAYRSTRFSKRFSMGYSNSSPRHRNLSRSVTIYSSKDTAATLDFIKSGTIVEELKEELDSANLQIFPNEEVQLETDAFGNVDPLYSDGGYNVYKGHTRSGRDVYVKRYNGESYSPEHVRRELQAMSMLRHQNILPCIGWSHEHEEFRIIYEFLPNGSLASHLDGKDKFLSWDARYKISLDLASAILYIHEECKHRVLHGNIKPRHVLLDSDLNAKLASFEFAKGRDHGEDDERTSVVGTFGYLDPEYSTTGIYSKASDVYSFGIVLLQIVTGLGPFIDREKFQQTKPSTPNDRDRSSIASLFEWVWEAYRTNKIFDVADKSLNKKYNKSEMERLLLAGLHCAQPSSSSRPPIGDVIRYLKFGGSMSTVLDKEMTFQSIPMSKPQHLPSPDRLPQPQKLPAQEIFDIGILADYSPSGPVKEFQLQIMRGYLSGLLEKLKMGAHFNEVIEAIKMFTASLVMLQAPLDDWNSLVQDVLRASKEMDSFKAKHNMKEVCLTTCNLSSLKNNMEKYAATVRMEESKLASSKVMLDSILREQVSLSNTKRDLDRQLEEIEMKIKDVECRRISQEDSVKVIEGEIMQYTEMLENTRLDHSVMTLYDSMLSKVTSFTCA